MTTNYWLQQHDKEVLAAEIEKHVKKKFGTVLTTTTNNDHITKEIKDYLQKTANKHHNAYIKMTKRSDNMGYNYSIEIP